MNNKALIEKTASATNQSEADVKLIVDAYIASLNMSLQQGTTVSIDDLGSFSVCTRAARTKRDPKTQEMQKYSGLQDS